MRFSPESENLYEQTMLRDYVQHYVIARLSRLASSLDFIFIGGTMLRLCAMPNYRYSEDLDFIIETSKYDAFYSLIQEIISEMNQHENFAISIKTKYQNNRSLEYIEVTGEFGKPVSIGLDINILEEDEDTEMRFLFDRYPSITESQELRCYTLTEVVSAKLDCLCNREKSRDIYDLVQLMSILGGLDEGFLKRYEIGPGDRAKTDLINLTESMIRRHYEFFKNWKTSVKDGFIPYDSYFLEDKEILEFEIDRLILKYISK